jgi:UDP-N-acetylmuramoyl-tripeptide--D-alanyl-D-alanine ligase
MLKLLQFILAWLAMAIIKKYQPQIVGITGSIGKTSAKEAIFCVLQTKFNARKNIKNYNNEIGVPLTIIGQESGGKSALGWLKVFSAAMNLIFFHDKEYPDILVLEMGADKPGDISYLVEKFPCDIGVITAIGPTHLEAFKTVEEIVKEKQKIVSHLKASNTAILNADDALVKKTHAKTRAKVIFFGYDESAGVRAIELDEQAGALDLAGVKFKIAHGGSAVPVFLPGVIGAHQINAALIGASVGIALGMNLIEISEGLKNYHSPKGRMNLISGRKTLIIDDTYNSSPKAAEAALKTLADAKIGDIKRKAAIFGDMLELGDFTEEAHYELGARTARAGIDILIAVGKFKDMICQGARENGMPEQSVFSFVNSTLAAQGVENIIQPGDLILVKGSQGSRMERVVKALMKEPEKAGELLVRQEREWERTT